MFYPKIHEQAILEISQGDYVSATAESFLIDRQARELSRHTLKFYREFPRAFLEYCNTNSLTFIQEITPDFLRRYFLAFGEKHNPGGVHGAYRTLRAFFQWLMKEEVMAPDWKNPTLKVKAPKVVLDSLEPISIQDIRALINTCQRGDFIGERDRALFLVICRYCAVTLLKTMRITSWHICAEVLSTIISEFKLCIELRCDLQATQLV